MMKQNCDEVEMNVLIKTGFCHMRMHKTFGIQVSLKFYKLMSMEKKKRLQHHHPFPVHPFI